MSATDLLAFEVADDSTLIVRLSGTWKLHAGMPSGDLIESELETRSPQRVTFAADDLGKWDSSVVSFLARASGAHVVSPA